MIHTYIVTEARVGPCSIKNVIHCDINSLTSVTMRSVLEFMGILVMPLLYRRQNVPLNQNENERRFFTAELHEKRAISVKQNKAVSQVFLNPFQPSVSII